MNSPKFVLALCVARSYAEQCSYVQWGAQLPIVHKDPIIAHSGITHPLSTWPIWAGQRSVYYVPRVACTMCPGYLLRRKHGGSCPVGGGSLRDTLRVREGE